MEDIRACLEQLTFLCEAITEERHKPQLASYKRALNMAVSLENILLFHQAQAHHYPIIGHINKQVGKSCIPC